MTTMTFNGKTFEVDDEIASIVHALNAAGIPTVASCSGHGMRPGRISLADGRELFVLPSYEIGQWFETQFPRDINGQTKEERAADEPKATDEGVADARRWIAYLESEPQHEPDISIARVLRDLVQFYEWALPQITNRTAEPPKVIRTTDATLNAGLDQLRAIANGQVLKISPLQARLILDYVSHAEPSDTDHCHADPIHCTPECRLKTCDHAWDFNYVPPQCAFGCGATLEALDAPAVTKSACTCPPGLCCERSGAAKSDQRICRDAGETKGGQS